MKVKKAEFDESYAIIPVGIHNIQLQIHAGTAENIIEGDCLVFCVEDEMESDVVVLAPWVKSLRDEHDCHVEDPTGLWEIIKGEGFNVEYRVLYPEVWEITLTPENGDIMISLFEYAQDNL